MAKYHALPYRFCHGNSSRFGYVICLQVTSGHDEGISNSNYGFVNFFGTTFTDYFHILNNDVPERKQMEVMRDIEHPHRVLEYDWSRRLEPF